MLEVWVFTFAVVGLVTFRSSQLTCSCRCETRKPQASRTSARQLSTCCLPEKPSRFCPGLPPPAAFRSRCLVSHNASLHKTELGLWSPGGSNGVTFTPQAPKNTLRRNTERTAQFHSTNGHRQNRDQWLQLQMQPVRHQGRHLCNYQEIIRVRRWLVTWFGHYSEQTGSEKMPNWFFSIYWVASQMKRLIVNGKKWKKKKLPARPSSLCFPNLQFRKASFNLTGHGSFWHCVLIAFRTRVGLETKNHLATSECRELSLWNNGNAHKHHPSAYLISVQRHATVTVSRPSWKALMHQHEPTKLNFHRSACVTVGLLHRGRACSETQLWVAWTKSNAGADSRGVGSACSHWLLCVKTVIPWQRCNGTQIC